MKYFFIDQIYEKVDVMNYEHNKFQKQSKETNNEQSKMINDINQKILKLEGVNVKAKNRMKKFEADISKVASQFKPLEVKFEDMINEIIKSIKELNFNFEKLKSDQSYLSANRPIILQRPSSGVSKRGSGSISSLKSARSMRSK